jgi:hypothetical protein
MVESPAMPSSRRNVWLVSAAVFVAGCSDTSKSAVSEAGVEAAAPVTDAASADAPVADAEGADAAEDSGPPGPFTGDCTTSRWAGVSDACWNCFCTTCKAATNACNLECVKGIACASANHTQVGVAADIPCEERAFAAECLTTPDAEAVVNQLVAFDTCLIEQHKAPEILRACETQCGFVYTGDVCQRFPGDAGSDASADASLDGG